MPETICPLPQSHTWESVWAKYKEVQKKYPGLTAAAHRKAAAQELGLDYATFLKLWKLKPKGAKIPLSVPTVPAAASEQLTGAISSTAKTELYASDVMKQIHPWENMYNKGLMTEEELVANIEKLDADPGLMSSGKNITTHFLKKYGQSTATQEAEVATKAAEEAVEYAETHLGPLTHDLAQSVYKKMKTDMPGATPAQLRHAAADYLNVDYDTYLKAWKKPTTGAAKKAAAKKLPPNTSTPLADDPSGYYADKKLTPDDLKTELAKLYGPSANKAFIETPYSSLGFYSVKLPNSLLPTQAAKDAVVDGLKKLGMDVSGPGPTGYYKISTSALKKSPGLTVKKAAAKKIAKKAAYPTAPVGEAKITNEVGHVVWNTAHANTWAQDWWAQLTAREQQAVRGYTGSGYQSLNKWLRGEGSMPSGGTATSNALSSALAKKPMPEGVTVYRGSPYPPITSFTEGQVWPNKQFLSTAAHKGAAWSGVKYEITIGPGVHGAYVDPHSSHRGELEVILDKNTKYRVLAVDRINNVVKLMAFL